MPIQSHPDSARLPSGRTPRSTATSCGSLSCPTMPCEQPSRRARRSLRFCKAPMKPPPMLATGTGECSNVRWEKSAVHALSDETDGAGRAVYGRDANVLRASAQMLRIHQFPAMVGAQIGGPVNAAAMVALRAMFWNRDETHAHG